jgi:hypothetical protein
VLDDLGSEPNIPNVSFEWLFAVINERTLAGARPLQQQLHVKAALRILRRTVHEPLCDRNTTQVLQLTGENLRTI